MIRITQWELFPSKKRHLEFYVKFMGWHVIQLGISIDLKMMNVEVFLPFGFVHFGLSSKYDVERIQIEKDMDDFVSQLTDYNLLD